jgi:ribonucleotide reductase alpha subunit
VLRGDSAHTFQIFQAPRQFLHNGCRSTEDGGAVEVEDSHYTPDTKVVSYNCRASVLDAEGVDEESVEDATELSLEDCLAVQKTVQDIYVDNSVSFTINVDTKTVTTEDLERALMAFGPDLKGTTICPTITNRPQMPYEKITKEAYYTAEHQHVGNGEAECKNGVCLLPGRTADDDGKV